MLLGGGWLLHILVPPVSLRHRVSSLLGLQSWVDHLISLVHIGAEVGSWLWLMEVERPWDSWCLTLLSLLHLGNEIFLKLSKVGHRSGPDWHEAVSHIGDCLTCGVKIFFLPSALLIDMSLHTWRQLGLSETLLSILSDPCLSFMLLAFHHHLELWNQDSPWNNPCPELVQTGSVNIISQIKCISSCLLISLMEREWLLRSLGLGNRLLLV